MVSSWSCQVRNISIGVELGSGSLGIVVGKGVRKGDVESLDYREAGLLHPIEEEGVGLVASFESNQNQYLGVPGGQLSQSLYKVKAAVWIVDAVRNQNQIEIRIGAIIKA